MSESSNQPNKIVKIVEEKMNIGEDVEIKMLIEKNKELQKKIDILDAERKKRFEVLQKQAKEILGVS